LSACILVVLLTGVGSVLAADAPLQDLGRLPFLITGPDDSVHWTMADERIYVIGFGTTGARERSPHIRFENIRMIKNGVESIPSSLPFFSSSGTMYWQDPDATDIGTWVFTVIARAESYLSENEYRLTVHVLDRRPLIGFRIGSGEAPPGTDVCIPLYIDNLAGAPGASGREIGGFDLLFNYDAEVVTFTGMDLDGSVLETAEWEYLTYRIVSTNPAKIRIVAIADMNNGNVHPSDWAVDGLLANVCFRVTNDRSLEGASSPIRFWWDDCGDNLVSSRDGNTLYMITDPGDGIPWFGGDPDAEPPIPGGGIIDNTDSSKQQLATFEGGITGPADYPCPNPNLSRPDPEPFLYFVNGMVTVERSSGDICDLGDLNLNGLAYEVADAVLYSNYFILGPSVFQPGIPGQAQVAASDVNTDGVPLTVADLVFMTRVIQGLAEPAADCGQAVSLDSGQAVLAPADQGSSTLVTMNASTSVGAVWLTLSYANTEIASIDLESGALDMDLLYHPDSGLLRILIWSLEDADSIPSGAGDLVRVHTTGGGTVTLVEAEVSTYAGALMQTTIAQPPAAAPDLMVVGNAPNPFNAQTSIRFNLDAASDYTLTIFNIAGQVVRTYAGPAEAGAHTITWDGRDQRNSPVASGVYFYRVEAGGFAVTKRMLLLK